MLKEETGDGTAVAIAQKRNKEIMKNDKRRKSHRLKGCRKSSGVLQKKGKGTVYEIWTYLEATFERKGVASQLRIRKALHNPKTQPSKRYNGIAFF